MDDLEDRGDAHLRLLKGKSIKALEDRFNLALSEKLFRIFFCHIQYKSWALIGKQSLTQFSLVDSFGREGKHGQQFDHYIDNCLCHRGSGQHLRINLESACEVFDAFKDVDEGIVAFPHVLGRLVMTLLEASWRG
jgi:hypothetical protein